METISLPILILFLVVAIWAFTWHCNQQKKKFKKLVSINIKKFKREHGNPMDFLNSDNKSTYSLLYRDINNANIDELHKIDEILELAYSQAKIQSRIKAKESSTPISFDVMQELDSKLANFKKVYGDPMNFLEPVDQEIWKEFSFENKAMIAKYWEILNRAYICAQHVSQICKKQAG